MYFHRTHLNLNRYDDTGRPADSSRLPGNTPAST
jgi:hypothetical protein